jgi:UDP-N-acetylglucosamine--N-acetylmuramyl-(pentapeptide) pyrophosphoryl-undecaprenol N-acetylglucosamine transferase
LFPRRSEIRFIHQTGPTDEEWVRAAYGEREFEAEVAAFFPEMGQAYGAAHLVICRAGAGTLSEICAVGRAAITVPYPHAAGDHQTKNAQALVKAGAARLIVDRNLDGQAAAAAITGLMDDPARRRRMEEMALGLAKPDAAGEIARHCLELLKEAA